MSLARAFTTRRGKQSSTDMGILPHRSNTTSRGHGQMGSIRNKISSPMELTHTTNMLAYNAPDLYPRAAAASSPASSSKSDDESSLNSPSTAMSSPPTSPEIPSAEGTSESPEPNHLSCYFTAPTQKPATNVREAPTIPQRAPSHTKKASFENLANKHARFSNQSSKTISTKASFSMSRSSSTSTAMTSVSSISHTQKSSVHAPIISPTSAIPASPTPRFRRSNDVSESQHPFGQELAKVSELAEELGVKDKLQGIEDEEEQLIAKGLHKFKAEDYLAEIHDLLSSFIIPEPVQAQQPVWI
ncbi:hypothetical protein F5B22DRAFT_222233 [Xylaria bambusicola]|uniref:uncharacterized protein n=1 Tax=Xylaria bambusicola TaxID=326684 RepID=UPI002007E773|nr:uncharacterized protein F5B22DRAFT_222233 [Xylaria bambusicola]KAI0514842.1 hypothetical protein F5B22DRAFT_222233 [Xylaria bambusicola]